MNYRLSAGIALLALASAATLPAQTANSFHFNLAAGASFPTGNFGNGTDVGYNLTAGIGMKPARPSVSDSKATTTSGTSTGLMISKCMRAV